MRTLQAVRALFHEGQVIRVVQNTKRPELDGTLRLLTKVGVGVMEATVLTGPGEGKSGFRMTLPTRARDVIAVDATAVTYRIADGAHTVTLSTIVSPTAATMRSRIATPAELAATGTTDVASDGPYAILDGPELIAISDDYGTMCWTADGVSTTDAEAALKAISDAAVAAPPPPTAVRVRLASSSVPGLPPGAPGTVARRCEAPPVVRFDVDGSERAVDADDLVVQPGRLIVVEGPAGVGASTIATALRDSLARHVPVHLLAEPTDPEMARQFVAGVAATVADGAWVIVDRPAERSLGRRAIGQRMGVANALNDDAFARAAVVVDRTVLLVVTSATAATRRPGSGRVALERAGDFFACVQVVYETLAETQPQRFVAIDANDPIHGVAAAAVASLDDLLHPANDVVCLNGEHDHFHEIGEEVSASWAPASARLCADGMTAVLTRSEPRRCNACGAPMHYDTAVENYRHDDPAVGCFLEAGGLRGASACIPVDTAVAGGSP